MNSLCSPVKSLNPSDVVSDKSRGLSSLPVDINKASTDVDEMTVRVVQSKQHWTNYGPLWNST